MEEVQILSYSAPLSSTKIPSSDQVSSTLHIYRV